MITSEVLTCPKCGGSLKYHDTISRIMRLEYGKSKHISVQRMRCLNCGSKHRVVPDDMLPNKQYREKIIYGFLSGEFSSHNLEYEDYPCESTIRNWVNEYKSISCYEE